jgi:hypothetical protein
MRIRILALALSVVAVARPAAAFHEKGVANCNGCHLTHGARASARRPERRQGAPSRRAQRRLSDLPRPQAGVGAGAICRARRRRGRTSSSSPKTT